MDCSLPGYSAHEIFQARVLEWGAIAIALPTKINQPQMSVMPHLKKNIYGMRDLSSPTKD